MNIKSLAFLFFGCVGFVAAAADRPNILFLFADDQRADTIGAHGNPHIQTPHLDRLAREGTSFLRNYCAGSFSGAVCVASRSMLMTGCDWQRISHQGGKQAWEGHPLLPAVLEEKGGYRSHIVGKWHNGLGTLTRSFQEGSAVYMGGMADHTSFEVQDFVDGKLTPRRPAGGFSSTVFADAAIRFVEGASEEQPFFLYVALMAPHDTRNPPEAYREMYYKKLPPLPENFLPLHPFRNGPATMMGRDEALAPWPRTPEVVRDQLAEYYGLITHLDEQVGRVLKALEESPHAKNTIVIYTADHGLGMGSHGLMGKQNVYEQSMRCPLIVRGPGVPAGRSTTAFTAIHDLHATVLAAAGVPLTPGIDGKDLAPLWSGKRKQVRDRMFLPFQDNQRAINDGRWKLHVYPQINHRLLFDLKNDPHETRNLAEDPAAAGELSRMMALMQEERDRVGDTQSLTVANPQPKEIAYDETKRFPDRWQPRWIRDKYFHGREAKRR